MIEAIYIPKTKTSKLENFDEELKDILECFEYAAETMFDNGVKDIIPSKPEEKYLFDKGDIEF